ncbi:MAG: zinc-ribbon domain-containing protein [Desulfovibrio sp.]|nr:zinc-ribbon domain-containing protein [Desulfovibrio sp.]
MKIECPQCGFHRDVNEDTFAGKETVIATCPQCHFRFRVSAKNGTIGPAPATPKKPAAPPQPQEEEEDIRLVAKRAYEREAERFAPGRSSKPIKNDGGISIAALVNPWEFAPGEAGWFSAFYQTVVRVMFSARLFFSMLPKDAPKQRAFVFYLIVAVIQCVMERVWSYVFYNYFSDKFMDDPQTAELLKLLEPDSNLLLDAVLRCGILVFQLYFFSLIMWLVYRLVAPAKSDFSLVFRIMAYSAAPSLLCVVPAIGSMAGLFWGLGCLAVGCKTAMELSWPKTLAGFAPLVLFFAPLLSGVSALLGQ